MKMVKRLVCFPKPADDALRAESVRTGLSISEVIRRFVDKGLEKVEAMKR